MMGEDPLSEDKWDKPPNFGQDTPSKKPNTSVITVRGSVPNRSIHKPKKGVKHSGGGGWGGMVPPKKT